MFSRLKAKLKSEGRPNQQALPSRPAPSAQTPDSEASSVDIQPVLQAPVQEGKHTSLVSHTRVDEKASAPQKDEPSEPVLQERLWNAAYDGVKQSKGDLVLNYEKLLSAELRGNPKTEKIPGSNDISADDETRKSQMYTLVELGLQRTRKDAAVKGAIGSAMQAVEAVRGIIDHSIKAAPEAAVAWVGVCFFMEIVSNPISESAANRDGITYVLSKMDWYWNLTGLLLDKNRTSTATDALRDELEKQIIGLFGELLSFQMRSVCLYHRHRLSTLARDMLKWDDWQGQVDGIKASEAAVQRSIGQYSTEEMRTYLHNLSKVAEAQQSSLQDIHSAIHDQTFQENKRHQDGKDEQCLKDLYDTDPEKDKKRIQENKGGLLKESYHWIVEHEDFRKWCAADEGTQNIFWIRGSPGKGKTMLLCGIIDELEEEPRDLAHFFCQATEAKLNNATAVIRGLVYMLCTRQPSLISHVRKKYDVTGPEMFEGPNTWVSLSDIFTNMMQDLSNDFYFVVDALDECTVDLSKLLRLITESPSHVKWVLSSRNWPEIDEQLRDFSQQLSLEDNESYTKSAVDAFINEKVRILAQKKQYDDDTKEAVRSYLMDHASGTFLWVALVCQELGNPKVRKRHTLTKLKSFPPGLEQFYGQMLEQVLSDEEDGEICQEVLSIMLVVFASPTLEELTCLVPDLEDLDKEDMKELVQSCGSFLAIRDNCVAFVHQSANDYLKSSENPTFRDSEPAHYKIFTRSLDALGGYLERDMCGLGHPGWFNPEFRVQDDHPLHALKYSCRSWSQHLKYSCTRHEALGDVSDDGIVFDFLKEHFLHWVEASSILGTTGSMATALQDLMGLQGIGTSLLRFLKDAWRLIGYHKRLIGIFPLQIYTTALVFSPRRSVVRQMFQHEEPTWMTRKPDVDQDWDACLQTFEWQMNDVMAPSVSENLQLYVELVDSRCFQVIELESTAVLSRVYPYRRGLIDRENMVRALLSPDGGLVGILYRNKELRFHKTATGVEVGGIESQISSKMHSVFVSDSRVALCGHRGGLEVWDVSTKDCIHKVETVCHSVFLTQRYCVFIRDGLLVEAWDLELLRPAPHLPRTADLLHEFRAASYDWLAACLYGEKRDEYEAFNLRTGQSFKIPEMNELGLIAYSESGGLLATEDTTRKTISVWDVDKKTRLQELGLGIALVGVQFSPDHQRLVTVGLNCAIQVWDLSWNDRLHGMSIDHQGDLICHAVSPDSKWLARTFSDDNDDYYDDDDKGGRIEISEMGNSESHMTIRLGRFDLPRDLHFSPDGSLLLGRTHEGIGIWNPRDGILITMIEVDPEECTSPISRLATTSSNRRYLLTCESFDCPSTASIWDIDTGRVVRVISKQGHRISSAALSPDGRRLATLVEGLDEQSGGEEEQSGRGDEQSDAWHEENVSVAWSSEEEENDAQPAVDEPVDAWSDPRASQAGSNGPASNGPSSIGAASDRHMSDGQMSDGQMSDGQMSDGQMSDGQMSDGQMSDGQMSEERMSEELRSMSQASLDDEMMPSSSVWSYDLDRPPLTKIMLWDVESGSCLGQLGDEGYYRSAGTFSSDGKRYATADDTKHIFWDLENNEVQASKMASPKAEWPLVFDAKLPFRVHSILGHIDLGGPPPLLWRGWHFSDGYIMRNDNEVILVPVEYRPVVKTFGTLAQFCLTKDNSNILIMEFAEDFPFTKFGR